MRDLFAKLSELKSWLDQGLLTQAQFEQAKANLFAQHGPSDRDGPAQDSDPLLQRTRVGPAPTPRSTRASPPGSVRSMR